MPLTPKQYKAVQQWREHLGRWEAARLGLRMNKGNWLVSTIHNKAVAHGYEALYYKHYRLIWTALNQEGK